MYSFGISIFIIKVFVVWVVVTLKFIENGLCVKKSYFVALQLRLACHLCIAKYGKDGTDALFTQNLENVFKCSSLPFFMRKYSIHILGYGRSGIIAKGVIAGLIQEKRSQGQHSPLEKIVIYHRQDPTWRRGSREARPIQNWLDVDGLTDKFVRTRSIDFSDPSTALLHSARLSLSQGTIPVFVIAARYSAPTIPSLFSLVFDMGLHVRTYREKRSLARVVQFALNEEVGGRKLISAEGRIAPLCDIYHTVTQLGKDLERSDRCFDALKNSYFLFVTNPVDITTTLFAASTGFNPLKVLGICDNDRTRYVTALAHYLRGAPHKYALTSGDRHALLDTFVGFGPHNEWGAITYASFVEGLEYLHSIVPGFSVEDPVELYGALSREVAKMGVGAFKDTGVLRDTSADVLHLLHLLFPPSCSTEDSYYPSAV